MKRKKVKNGLFGLFYNNRNNTIRLYKLHNQLNFHRLIKAKQTQTFSYQNIKPTKFNKLFHLRDIDKDGVADIFDCRPKNRRYQDVKPNMLMKKRINKLPIFVTEKNVDYDKFGKYGSLPRKKYHISDKHAPKEAKRRFYSLVKKYPQVIGEIEKHKPRGVILTTKDNINKIKGWAQDTEEGQAIEGVSSGRGAVIIRAGNIPYAKKKKFSRYDIQDAAGTAVHELEHIRQNKSWSNKQKLQERMEKGRYSTRRSEVIAREAETKLYKTRPEEQMKVIEKSEVEKKHPRIYSRIKERYEKYKKRREEQKLRSFRETFKDDEITNT